MDKDIIQLGKPCGSGRIIINGVQENREYYRVPISKLFYNDQNGRIASFISGYNSKENNTPLNTLDIDKYNNIIMGFVKESGSQDKYNKTKDSIRKTGQMRQGIILRDGRVIDGNRRFTCLRELYEETKDERYAYFECFVLDVPATEDEKKAIKTLELKYQFGEDEKEKYNPIDYLVSIYECLVKEPVQYEPEEYIERINGQETLTRLKTSIEKAKIMVDYLDTIGFPNRFDIARKDKIDGPIEELARLKKKIGENRWKVEKRTIFENLNAELKTAGDTTRKIREFIKVFENNPEEYKKIKDRLFRLSSMRMNGDSHNSLAYNDELSKTIIQLNESKAIVKKNEAQCKQINIIKSALNKLKEVDKYELIQYYKINKEEVDKELDNIEKIINELRKCDISR